MLVGSLVAIRFISIMTVRGVVTNTAGLASNVASVTIEQPSESRESQPCPARLT